MRSSLTNAVRLGGFVSLILSGVAQAAEPTPDWVLSGSATLASDYIFRGVSQTQHSPVMQAGVETAHKSGVYLGVFGSGVSNAAYNNGSGTEVDLYGGYRYTINDTQNLDLGLVTYWYPRAHWTTRDNKEVDYNTQEAKLAYNIGALNITGWVGLSEHWFGFVDNQGSAGSTRGSNYIEANWSPTLTDGVTLNLHAGSQRIRGKSDFNFSDVKVGVTWTLDKWALAAAVTHNNGKESKNGEDVWTFRDADGHGVRVTGTRALVSATYNF